MLLKQFQTKQGSLVYYVDPLDEIKPKYTILYFALSGQASLTENPFNQPVVKWTEAGFRVISWDLPFHTPQDEIKNAMYKWALAFQDNPFFLNNFIKSCQQILSELIDQQFIDPTTIGICGLSRGAFIATHFAAVDPRIQIILGFAPLTKPRPLEEFGLRSFNNEEKIDLHSTIKQLIGKKLHFYISNEDSRVGTDFCYQFIRQLTKANIEIGIRSPLVELTIYPCIGYKGHGTPPLIFEAGANWIMQQLRGI